MKILLFVLALLPLCSGGQIIYTVTGDGTGAYVGDHGAASSAEVNRPSGVATDALGNIYIADKGNNVIRKINTSGIISTVAGNGFAGYLGDGAQATAARLNGPTHVYVDTARNLYISDYSNNVIRKVNTAGVISTIAGNGVPGYVGDGFTATSASLDGPSSVGIDTSGNIYITDYLNNVVRKINTSGKISTFAGTGSAGYSGDGGFAVSAKFNGPVNICIDSLQNIYIADGTNSAVRKINTSGYIYTVAGTGVNGFTGDGIPATSSELFNPDGIFIRNSNLFIADQNNNRLRMVNSSGIIETIAGNGTPGYGMDGVPATSTNLDIPTGVCLDMSGNVYIADQLNNRVRKLSICIDAITSQPSPDTVISGATATFTVTTSAISPVYQWQEDPGTGFTNLANVWPYSGVTTNALTIHNASIYLNATHYRCVIDDGSVCIDTSSSAILIIHSSSDIKDLSAAGINIFPNPANGKLCIEQKNGFYNGQIYLINELGETVAQTIFTGNITTVDVHTLPGGMYFVKIKYEDGSVFYKKILKN